MNVDASCEPDRLVTGQPAMVCGTVPTPVPPGGIVRFALFQGSELDLAAVTKAPVWGEIPPGADGRFAGGMTENVVEDATVLLVELLDGDGGVIAAATERLPAPGASEPSPSRPGIGDGSQPELTDQVKDARSAIMAAADAGSYEGLRRLIGQGFTFSFGDTGGESSTADRAIAFWQRDGVEPLRVMAALLEMPYTTVPTDEGLIYAWPAFYDWTPDQLSRIDELAPEWRGALERIYPDFDRQLQSWIDFGGYLGWRIGIAEDGRWMFFVAGD